MADMQPPQQATAKVEDIFEFNDRFVEYHFEFTQPHIIDFLPGQYVSLKVAENGTRRSYSICHRVDENHGFHLLVDLQPQGPGTQYLGKLEPGQEVEVLAPLGRFVLQDHQPEDEIYFVATGSGIAPFKSMITQLLQIDGAPNKMELHWGMRHAHHLFWLDEFSQIDDAFEQFHFLPVLSRPPSEWNLSTGHVTDVFETKELADPSNVHVYLCGNAPMIHDMLELAKKKGIPDNQVYQEKFY